MQRDRTANAEQLLHDVGWAMEHGLPARELIPMLKKLVAHAPEGSHASLFGMRELAKLMLPRDAWQAARLARSVLRHGDDYEAWSVLGVALSVLGHYRAAAHAHRAALAIEPGCPIAAHNLGHMLDAGLDQPARAIHHLLRAHRARPHDEEIAGSYAHALARVGRREEAVAVLGPHLPGGAREADSRIDVWLAGRKK